MALNLCLSWNYRFSTKRVESDSPRVGPTYELWCEETRIGSFSYFANKSRPEAVLNAVWGKCGAGRPWLDEEDEFDEL